MEYLRAVSPVRLFPLFFPGSTAEGSVVTTVLIRSLYPLPVPIVTYYSLVCKGPPWCTLCCRRIHLPKGFSLPAFVTVLRHANMLLPMVQAVEPVLAEWAIQGIPQRGDVVWI